MAPNGDGQAAAPEHVGSKGYLLDVPTGKGLIWAGIVIAVFMGAAWCVYSHYDKELKDYALKLADTFIQGSVVGIFFAIAKTIIEQIKVPR
jgi:hypothetical protein